jgi:hypothetical protein
MTAEMSPTIAMPVPAAPPADMLLAQTSAPATPDTSPIAPEPLDRAWLGAGLSLEYEDLTEGMIFVYRPLSAARRASFRALAFLPSELEHGDLALRAAALREAIARSPLGPTEPLRLELWAALVANGAARHE